MWIWLSEIKLASDGFLMSTISLPFKHCFVCYQCTPSWHVLVSKSLFFFFFKQLLVWDLGSYTTEFLFFYFSFPRWLKGMKPRLQSCVNSYSLYIHRWQRGHTVHSYVFPWKYGKLIRIRKVVLCSTAMKQLGKKQQKIVEVKLSHLNLCT